MPQTCAAATISVRAVPSQTVVQATGTTPGSAIQFTAVPAPTETVAASTGNTAVASTQVSTTTTASTTPAPIQYVHQPRGGARSADQPFQIPWLPQFFRTSSTYVILCSQTRALLTDANRNTIPVVQVVSQAGGLKLPIVQDTFLTRTQRPAVLAANSVGAVSAGVDEQVHNTQPQTSIFNAADCAIKEENDGRQQETMPSQRDMVGAVNFESSAVLALVAVTSDVVAEAATKSSVLGVLPAHSGELCYSSHSDYSSDLSENNRLDTDRQPFGFNSVVNAEGSE
ncbi:hypothetical protein FGIG_08090 [Fasciola gigantica]|uniref:Uncharacterized protein n=1 Tax=Fasciola gigantica TaxID=46835 RepID=A0A504Z5L0_FASGI|nr:hypothetical protein FGIG_08090 [Fasciola gigantica]